MSTCLGLLDTHMHMLTRTCSHAHLCPHACACTHTHSHNLLHCDTIRISCSLHILTHAHTHIHMHVHHKPQHTRTRTPHPHTHPHTHTRTRTHTHTHMLTLHKHTLMHTHAHTHILHTHTYSQDNVKNPRETRHTFTPHEGGNIEETTVELELLPTDPPLELSIRSTSSTISSQQPMPSVDFNSPTQAQAQLSGVWASRAQLPLPLEPRDTLKASENRTRPKTPGSRQGESAADQDQQPTFEYQGQPLLGAWAKPGVSGASVIRGAVDQKSLPRAISPLPHSSSGSHSSNSRLSSGSNYGARTPDLKKSSRPGDRFTPQRTGGNARKSLKHSLSGPAKEKKDHAYMPRRSQSEKFQTGTFQNMGNTTQVRGTEDYIHHHHQPRSQQGSRGAGHRQGQQRNEPMARGELVREGVDRLNQGDEFDGRNGAMDYIRSYSDTTTLNPIHEADQLPNSGRPVSEPTSRGRGRTRNRRRQGHGPRQ